MNKEINRLDKISRGMKKVHALNCEISEIQKRLINSNVKKVEITENDVIFTIEPHDIKIISDGSSRAAPLEVLQFGNYENKELEMIYNLISNDPILLDIGAHIGWYSINFAKNFPSAKIYSFEPIEATYNVLNKNIQINELINVTTFNFGLSNEEAMKHFYLFSEGTTFASMENIVNHPDAQKVSCSVKKLDDSMRSLKLDHIDFIKCDVEGAELMVLKGATNTIETFHPILFLEIATLWCDKFNYDPNDILKFMRDRGYLCFILEENLLLQQEQIKLDRTNYNNYYFLHQDKHSYLIEKYIKS